MSRFDEQIEAADNLKHKTVRSIRRTCHVQYCKETTANSNKLNIIHVSRHFVN